MHSRTFAAGLVGASLAYGLAGVSAQPSQTTAQSGTQQAGSATQFTYQGSLIQGDAPVSTPHDLHFSLFDVETAGSQIGATVAVTDVEVVSGVFTVPIDFGPDIFDGRALWLEVAVRPTGNPAAPTTLTPRQPLTAAPYALHSSGAWSLKGNTDTVEGDAFIGTTDNTPLELRTNNLSVMRLHDDGRVGINTLEPSAKFEVTSDDRAIVGSGGSRGVIGRINATPCDGSSAVAGCAGTSGFPGVVGNSAVAFGVLGISHSATGVGGNSTQGTGVQGVSSTGRGVFGTSGSSNGVLGNSSSGTAVEGSSGTGIGVHGNSTTRGIVGTLNSGSCAGAPYGVGGCVGATGGTGVLGRADAGFGVRGFGPVGVQGDGSGRGVVGTISSAPCEGTFAVGGCSGASGVPGVVGDSTSRGVVGTLSGTPCGGAFAVGGCSGNSAAVGVYGHSSNTAAMWARTETGDLFVGVTGASEVRRARIDWQGRGYFNNGTQTGGADYAESMRTTDDPADLEPGDVLSLDPNSGYAVRLSREPNSRLVAGVYSTRPSILAIGDHHIDDSLEGEVPVALLGVVPTKVTAANGPIHIGDLLVSAALPGHAMKVLPDVVGGIEVYPTGAILGKALEPLLSGTGVIKVLVTLR